MLTIYSCLDTCQCYITNRLFRITSLTKMPQNLIKFLVKLYGLKLSWQSHPMKSWIFWGHVSQKDRKVAENLTCVGYQEIRFNQRLIKVFKIKLLQKLLKIKKQLLF